MKKFIDNSLFKLFPNRGLSPVDIDEASRENYADWIKQIHCVWSNSGAVSLTITPSDQESKKALLLSNIQSMLSDAKIDAVDSDMKEDEKLDIFRFEQEVGLIKVTTQKPKVFVSQLANGNIISPASLAKLNFHIDSVLRTHAHTRDQGVSRQLLG